MRASQFAILVVVAAVASVPLAPLTCNADEAAAAACCRERPNDCNQPAARDSACCRDTPEHTTPSVTIVVQVGAPAHAPTLEATRAIRDAARERAARYAWWLASPLDLPPAALSVLRI
jgi:hypothetical protein